MYLNNFILKWFGGIEDASKKYFGVSVSQLSLDHYGTAECSRDLEIPTCSIQSNAITNIIPPKYGGWTILTRNG